MDKQTNKEVAEGKIGRIARRRWYAAIILALSVNIAACGSVPDSTGETPGNQEENPVEKKAGSVMRDGEAINIASISGKVVKQSDEIGTLTVTFRAPHDSEIADDEEVYWLNIELNLSALEAGNSVVVKGEAERVSDTEGEIGEFTFTAAEDSSPDVHRAWVDIVFTHMTPAGHDPQVLDGVLDVVEANEETIDVILNMTSVGPADTGSETTPEEETTFTYEADLEGVVIE